MSEKPDIVILMTDEERAIPPYESPEVLAWRDRMLKGRKWFDEHGVWFQRHYTGSLACVPSRPTIFTGQYPDLHGVTQTDGIGKVFDDSRMRWLRQGEVPTLGNWFRAAGYDTHYDGKRGTGATCSGSWRRRPGSGAAPRRRRVGARVRRRRLLAPERWKGHALPRALDGRPGSGGARARAGRSR